MSLTAFYQTLGGTLFFANAHQTVKKMVVEFSLKAAKRHPMVSDSSC
jgi:hypothetical protein